jgi:hypothetical protein
MKKWDAEKLKKLGEAMEADLRKLVVHYKKGAWKEMGSLIGEDATLIFLKSRQMYKGKKAILNFWRQMKRKGLKDIRFDIKRRAAAPADFLLSETCDQVTCYMAYDFVHYNFGTCQFVFNPNVREYDCLVVLAHKEICRRQVSLIVLS